MVQSTAWWGWLVLVVLGGLGCDAASGLPTCGVSCPEGETCRGGSCVAAAACDDHVRNGDEVDVDCGGCCPPCALGASCAREADCESGVCGASGLCVADACGDGRQGPLESDVDCGGACGATCPPAAACDSGADCLSLTCGPDHRCAVDACAGQPTTPGARFPGVTVVKALAGEGRWLVLTETLQRQTMVTIPARAMALFDGHFEGGHVYPPLDGWTLVDAALHPSGAVTAVYVRADYSYFNEPPRAVAGPLAVQLSRYELDGSRVDTALPLVAASDPYDVTKVGMTSHDRARIVADGEAAYVVVRWAGNAVYAHRLVVGASGYVQQWVTRVEPESSVPFYGIIGGGFDNFHQGDYATFVYLDVDAAGQAYVAVPSTSGALAAHDAAFGDDLSAGADPANLDFGTAILTKIEATGGRAYARLLGTPGNHKSLLGLHVEEGSVLLAGRVKTGSDGDWDGWVLAAEADTGGERFQSTVDVQLGDVFWDAVPAPNGQTIAVGSTGYTQNPSGVSVSDERWALAVRLDGQGRLIERLPLDEGVTGRGDEALFAFVQAGCVLVTGGMLDGPGTHAEVHSDGFVRLRALDAPP